MSHPLHVIILAAGAGKRMKSALPKVLQPVAGRPMLAHVIETARQLQPAGIHVVHGHGGEAVRAAFAGQDDLAWPSRCSSWAPAMPCCRRCRPCRTPRRCWCCTATCR